MKNVGSGIWATQVGNRPWLKRTFMLKAKRREKERVTEEEAGQE